MPNRQSNRRNKLIRKLPHRKHHEEEVAQEHLPRTVSGSPIWSNNVKLVAGLCMIVVIAWLMARFRNVVVILLLASLFAYLLYPFASFVRNRLNLSWRLASTLVFLLTVLVVFGLLFLGGFTIVTQSQSLINFLQTTLQDGLPSFMNRLPTFDFGNIHFPPANLSDLGNVGQELLGLVNPVLSQTTSVLTSVASSAATFIGWTFFTLLVTYFILAESKGIPGQMIRFNIPGYESDIKQFGRYLSGIWNAFLRGQLIIILITILVYSVVLSILGVHFAFGLAVLAGLARFVPYVGPAVAWTTFGLVAFFQGSLYYDVQPFWFAVLVVGAAWTTDLIMDNLVAARLMGNALQIHPAAVMVSAIVAANLLGLIGLLIAAPVVATMKLVFEYLLNKLFDQDPWERVKTYPPPVPRSLVRFLRFHMARMRTSWSTFQKRFKSV
jgi:predicted PurR-regulated permease PerM